MAGFCIEVRDRTPLAERAPLQLVSLGRGEQLHTYDAGPIRVLWSRWPESRHLFVRDEPDRWLWIEGHPDRLPFNGESLAQWLSGRWGSFRGFEINKRALTVTIFCDPLGTRPIFYLRTPEAFYVSDKLATLAMVGQGNTGVNWGALLEALILGTVYSEDTTLVGAEEVPAGEALIINDGKVSPSVKCAMPDHPIIKPQEVLNNPSKCLLAALKCAVEEVWDDPETPILLSGGLDSRLTLRLAGPGRKAITVTTRENRESRIARRVAHACGAEFHHITRPMEQYHRVVRDADLLGAAMYQPTHANHLHMTSEWREEGVQSVTHAYYYGTFLKGVFLLSPQQTEAPPSFLDALGANASRVLSFKARRFKIVDMNLMYGVLSKEGKELVFSRLKNLADSFLSDVTDGDVTALERMVLSRPSRCYTHPNLLGWMEEVDLYSPIFHPAIWSWHTACPPHERYNGRAFIGALHLAGRDICVIPDANTGRPVVGAVPLYDLWDRSVRIRGIARRARKALRALLRKGPEDFFSWPPLAPIFRLPGGRVLLEEGLAELERCPFIARSRLHSMFLEYLKGRDQLIHTVLPLVGAARWIARVRGD